MVEMEHAIQQNKELRRAADDVLDLRRCVSAYKDIVSDAWRGSDSNGLKNASDELGHLLSGISKELNDIARDILVLAQEFEAENEQNDQTED
ncbi:MAG: hypothetical protein K5678_09760 [Acetatifactor sp.]|nr:hypothetical protein [Acetatifactor sp.]